jgi:hypothetical protein
VNTLRRAAVLELEGATYEGRLTEVLEMIAVLHSDNGFKRKARRRLRAWMLRTVEKKRKSKEEKSFSTGGNRYGKRADAEDMILVEQTSSNERTRQDEVQMRQGGCKRERG